MDSEDIVVCKGRVIKVEEVPMRNGVAPHTETLIDFTEDAKLLNPSSSSYNGPTPLKQLSMMAELKYGKQYEVVLREVRPELALNSNARQFQE